MGSCRWVYSSDGRVKSGVSDSGLWLSVILIKHLISCVIVPQNSLQPREPHSFDPTNTTTTSHAQDVLDQTDHAYDRLHE